MTTVTTKDGAHSCNDWEPKSSDDRDNRMPFFGDAS
jgi:hypothetical protein